MARRRKEGENLKRISETDKDAGIAMNNVHAMKREHLHAIGLSDSRINAFTWDKVFEKFEEPKTGEFIWIKGANYNDWISKNTDIEFRGKGSSNQDGSKHHDLALANHYCFNMTREEQLSCRTEAQQRYEFEEFAHTLTRSDDEDEREKGYQMLEDLKNNNVSMCDFAYTSGDGEEIGFEITTDSYTPEMVEAKQSYCESAGLTFMAQHVK